MRGLVGGETGISRSEEKELQMTLTSFSKKETKSFVIIQIP